MDDDFSLMAVAIGREQALREIRDCVPDCEAYGLTLSEADIRELVTARQSALTDTGRVEFEGGILPKLIRAFADSPFVDRENWVGTLMDLQEAFYYFKGDAAEQFSDDELIDYMVKVFNGRAQGSAEFLIGTSLVALCRYAREIFDPRSGRGVGDLF